MKVLALTLISLSLSAWAASHAHKGAAPAARDLPSATLLAAVPSVLRNNRVIF